MLSVQSFIARSGLGRDSFCYGIGLPQVSSSRLPVNDDVFQFIFNSSPHRKRCCRYEALFVQSGVGRDSYLYGIGFSQVSSSKLPVNDAVFQFITAARRKRCCRYEALFVQSGVGRDSYLYGLRFSQVSPSRLPIDDDFSNSPSQRVKNHVVSTKLYLHNLVSVASRICMVQGSRKYHQAGYPSKMMFFNSSPQRVENDVVSTKLYSHNLVSVAIRVCMV